MKTDELDALPDPKLSDVFAVEVAGWEMAHGCHPIYGDFCYKVSDEPSPDGFILAKFATSADAVLPFLVRDYSSWMAMPAHAYQFGVLVSTDSDHGEPEGTSGEAPTFARAACIALIRAKRAQQP